MKNTDNFQPVKSKHKVSIVMVTWNAAKFLPFVLDSIQKQSLKDYNVLIIDNASIDDTVDLIQNKYFPLVKFVKQRENSGFARGYSVCTFIICYSVP